MLMWRDWTVSRESKLEREQEANFCGRERRKYNENEKQTESLRYGFLTGVSPAKALVVGLPETDMFLPPTPGGIKWTTRV